MNHLKMLLKREFWEHRGGFLWAPVWTAGFFLMVTLMGWIWAEFIASGKFNGSVHIGVPLKKLMNKIPPEEMGKLGMGLDISLAGFWMVIQVVLFFVLFFYLIGALYDDRKDRSVLFWKSLPVSDTATVLSKVAAAVLLAPLISFLVATVAYVALLVVVGIWTLFHGLNPLPAIAASHTLGLFWRMLLTLPVDALLALPTVGWLLFWSAYARSKPFLWAVLVPLFAFIANSWIGMMGLPSISRRFMLEELIGRLLFGIFPGQWLNDKNPAFIDPEHAFERGNMLSLLDPSNVYGLLATPGIWIGAAAGIAMIAAAVWLRRSRIETST